MKQRLTNESGAESAAQADRFEQQTATGRLEFEWAEDAIRYDAARTEVPPHTKERLMRVIAGEERPRPWWKRWLRL